MRSSSISGRCSSAGIRYGPYVGRMALEQVEAFFADIDFPSFNHHQDAGRPWAQARSDVLARFPEHEAAFDVYVDHFADALPGPVPGSEELVRDLVEAGVRTLGLTNWSAETFHLAEPAAPAVGLLEDVLVSGTVGLAKPDPRIFRLLVERFALTRGRTLFTDDSPAERRGSGRRRPAVRSLHLRRPAARRARGAGGPRGPGRR